MSPDEAPAVFGRTRWQAARAALLIALLGCGVVAWLERVLTRPQTPLGEAFHATGIPPLLPFLLGTSVVVVVALMGFWQSVRTAERYRLTERGLEVEGTLGGYTLEWENIRRAEVTSTGALGIQVTSREAVVATHRGTEAQRELLRTTEPFGTWDYLFTRPELGRRPAEVLEWMRPRLGPG
jgi:hypothetical protein